MSGFGIGLGAFMESFTKSREMRLEREERAEDRKIAAEERTRNNKREDASDARVAQRFDWDAEDRSREEGDRQRVKDIQADTRAGFDRAVEAGEADADGYTDYWTKHGLPVMQQEALSRGDVDGAKSLMDWGESENVKKGARLFRSAMSAATQGDPSKALELAIQAGNVDGYLDNGIEMLGHEELVDKAGNVLGYRVKMKGEDGAETTTDIKVDDVPSMIATYANPTYAWEVQKAAVAKKAEKADDLDTYERKAEIDRKTGKGGKTYDRQDAIVDLEKGDTDVLRDDSQPKFADLPAADKEAKIAQRLELMNGAGAEAAAVPAAPAGKVVVDKSTGQAVPGIGVVPAVPNDAQLGLGSAAPLRTPEQAAAVDRVADEFLSGKRPAGAGTYVDSKGGVRTAAVEKSPLVVDAKRQVAPGSPAQTPATGPAPTDAKREREIAKALKMVRTESAKPEAIAQILRDNNVSGEEFKAALAATR